MEEMPLPPTSSVAEVKRPIVKSIFLDSYLAKIRNIKGGEHGHIGFYIGDEKAISNDTPTRVPR